MLPNTAGCQTAEEAILSASLAEMGGYCAEDVSHQVIPDLKYFLLHPDWHSARTIAKRRVYGLFYINADPILAKRLEDAGQQ